MEDKAKHPIQPLIADEQGVLRFKKNKIVEFLFRNGPFDMERLAMMPFDNGDWEQFAQLIGYSLSGFGDLSYVSDDTYLAAEAMANSGKDERDAKIESLQSTVDALREKMKPIATELYNMLG